MARVVIEHVVHISYCSIQSENSAPMADCYICGGRPRVFYHVHNSQFDWQHVCRACVIERWPRLLALDTLGGGV